MPPSTNIMFRTGSSARSERFGGGRERPSFKDCRSGADKGGNGIAEMEREIITGKRFGEERALYSSRGIELRNCAFQGEEDGESALKESGDVVARNCLFDLRYPMWHVKGLTLDGCELTVNCRAALWYDSDVRADIKGGIDSVKDPLGGSITADGIGEIILGGAKYPCNADIRVRGMG